MRFLNEGKDVNSPRGRGQASVHHLGWEKDNTHLYTHTNRPWAILARLTVQGKMVRARSVGSLNSLQHMRGTRGSSALGRINSYLGGDARRRGRGMMTLVRGGRAGGRLGRRCARELRSRWRRARRGPAWTRRNTKHTLGKNNWPPEALPEMPDVSRGGRPGGPPPPRREAVFKPVDRCIRPNRRSRNERWGGTTGGR